VRLFASLDLAETVAIGLARLVNSMGVATAEEGLYNLWRSAHHRTIRWRLRPFIWKVAEALSAVAAEHIGHPLLEGDSLCRKHGLFSPPRYGGGAVQVRLKLAGLIAAAAEQQIRERTSFLYTQRMAVFASDTELGASEVTYKALCIALHRGWTEGALTKDDVSWLMTKYVMPLGSSKDTEEERVAEARALAYGICGWARQRQRHGLARDLERLGGGHRLVLYPIAVEEALREMRKGYEWGLTVTTAPRQSRRFVPHACRPCGARWERRPVAAERRWRTLSSTEETAIAVAVSQMEASRGRVYGTLSSAHYSFAACIPAVLGRDVLVVGTGHGAIARLCLEAGARAVYGVDLASSLPLEGHNFRWYKPPMVRESDGAHRYVQLPESFTTTGDWYDPDVSSSILRSLLPSTIVIVDIQSGASRATLSVLDPLIDENWPTLVYVRVFATVTEVELLLSDISAGGGRVEVFLGAPARETEATQMFLLAISRMPSAPALCLSPAVVVTPVFTAPPDMSYMGGGQSFLLGAVAFDIVPVGPTDSLTDVRRRLADVVVASHGDYLSRPTYSHWSLLLYALVACDFVAAPDATRRRYLRRLVAGSPIAVRASSLHLTVDASFHLLRHLCKVASRLI
jgi:hypothetical protein